MFDFPVEYEGKVYRPPSEGRSFLLQVTIGCSNNKCTYCNMYRDKTYRERNFSEVLHDIKKASEYYKNLGYTPDKIFLCDGDALGASSELINQTLIALKQYFPNTRRIGAYTTAENILEKSINDLKQFFDLGLSIAYLGMESGCDKVLKRIVKGNNQKDMIEASLKIKKAGWKLSVIVLLGVTGKTYFDSHILETGKVLSIIEPTFLSFLTIVSIPGTPYERMSRRKSYQRLTTKELLEQMGGILSLFKNEKEKTIFRANHVSNQFPIGGTLPRDKEMILRQIQNWIEDTPENTFPQYPDNM